MRAALERATRLQTAAAVPASAHPLVDRAPRVVLVRGAAFGGSRPVLIGALGVRPQGSGAWTSLERLADALAAAGGRFVEAGSLAPEPAAPLDAVQLRRLRALAGKRGLGLVAPVQSPADVSVAADEADLVLVPPHLMQSFDLLRAAGAAGRPVVLCRAQAASLEEWLLAAEYVLLAGAPGLVLCESGVRTPVLREQPMLDLWAVAALRAVHRLPVLAAPTRAACRPELVAALGRAALAAGACGLVLELDGQRWNVPPALAAWRPE